MTLAMGRYYNVFKYCPCVVTRISRTDNCGTEEVGYGQFNDSSIPLTFANIIPAAEPLESNIRSIKGSDGMGSGPSRGDILTKFSKFSCLPKEIRLHIWKLASRTPRVVEVHPTLLKIEYTYLRTTERDAEYLDLQVNHLRSRTAPPPLLRACYESREVALPLFKKTVIANPFIPDSVYFECEIDTMYLTADVLDQWAWNTDDPIFIDAQMSQQPDQVFLQPLGHEYVYPSCVTCQPNISGIILAMNWSFD